MVQSRQLRVEVRHLMPGLPAIPRLDQICAVPRRQFLVSL